MYVLGDKNKVGQFPVRSSRDGRKCYELLEEGKGEPETWSQQKRDVERIPKTPRLFFLFLCELGSGLDTPVIRHCLFLLFLLRIGGNFSIWYPSKQVWDIYSEQCLAAGCWFGKPIEILSGVLRLRRKTWTVCIFAVDFCLFSRKQTAAPDGENVPKDGELVKTHGRILSFCIDPAIILWLWKFSVVSFASKVLALQPTNKRLLEQSLSCLSLSLALSGWLAVFYI